MPKNVEILNGEYLDEFWVENECTGHINSCDCGYFPEGAIQYTCDAFSGFSDIELSVGTTTWIADIPPDVQDLNITLTSNVDFDLRLMIKPEDDDTADCAVEDECECLAGYDCTYNTTGYFQYESMEMYFSGDSRTNPVEEPIMINATSMQFKLYVKA
jgi:hypothetical protein